MSADGTVTAPDDVVVDEVTTVTSEVLEALRELVPELSSSAPPLTNEALEEIVRSPATVLFVARDAADGTILGSLTLVVFSAPTGPRAWIEDVVVIHRHPWTGCRGGSRPCRQCPRRPRRGRAPST